MPDDMNTTLDRILQDLADTRRDLHGEIADTRQSLAHEIADTRQALEGRIDGVEKKLDSFRDETLANFDELYLAWSGSNRSITRSQRL